MTMPLTNFCTLLSVTPAGASFTARSRLSYTCARARGHTRRTRTRTPDHRTSSKLSANFCCPCARASATLRSARVRMFSTSASDRSTRSLRSLLSASSFCLEAQVRRRMQLHAAQLARASGAHDLLERSGLDRFLGALPTLCPSFTLAVRSLCFSGAAPNNNKCHMQ
jgi:hypothetical protein